MIQVDQHVLSFFFATSKAISVNFDQFIAKAFSKNRKEEGEITKNIKLFIPPIFFRIHEKFKTQKKKFKIGAYEIEVPPNYGLPHFQEQCKLYDRFLPVLAKHFSSNNLLIIDVGANIGDTTIAIMQNCKNSIVCIEPSEVYFPYLEKNLKKLTTKDFERVKTIKKFVGTGSFSGKLDHSIHGTASVYSTKIQILPLISHLTF